jgi:phosphoglucomutase
MAATASQRLRLAALSALELRMTRLGGERIESVLDHAPGNDVAMGGIKVIAASGWFVALPSGTEDVCRIHAESFRGEDHLRTILDEAQSVVEAALAGA